MDEFPVWEEGSLLLSEAEVWTRVLSAVLTSADPDRNTHNMVADAAQVADIAVLTYRKRVDALRVIDLVEEIP